MLTSAIICGGATAAPRQRTTLQHVMFMGYVPTTGDLLRLAAVTATSLLLMLLPLSAAAQNRAFPSCEGGGCEATGGRGGTIFRVTNLDDTGTGSLRACMTASGTRTCVIQTCGTLTLTSGRISVFNDNLSVIGQTACGGGLLVSGVNLGGSGMEAVIQISASNVIMRYLRVRKGYDSFCAVNTNPGCGKVVSLIWAGASGTSMDDIVFDHNSLSWSTEDLLFVGATQSGAAVNDVTVSWNLGAESFPNHATGFTSTRTENYDLHHNLLMNIGYRNSMLDNSRFTNNISYHGYSAYYHNGSTSKSHDLVSNIWKRGPTWSTGNLGLDHDVVPYSGSYYMSGNIGTLQSDPDGDQWALCAEVSGFQTYTVVNDPCPAGLRRATPQTAPTFPVTVAAVADLPDLISPIVGASRRLDCNGSSWVANRDAVDTRLVAQYVGNTAQSQPSDEGDVGGYPTIATTPVCADTDSDGMFDDWEIAVVGDLSATANGTTVAAADPDIPDYYTNIEVFYNYPEFSAEAPEPFSHCGAFDVDPTTGTRGGTMIDGLTLPYGTSEGVVDAYGQKIWPDCATLEVVLGADDDGQTYGDCAQDATGATCDADLYFAPTAHVRVTGGGLPPRWVEVNVTCGKSGGCTGGSGATAGYFEGRAAVDLSAYTLDEVHMIRVNYCITSACSGGAAQIAQAFD